MALATGAFHGAGCYTFSKANLSMKYVTAADGTATAATDYSRNPTGWTVEGSVILLCLLSVAPIRRRSQAGGMP